MHLDDSLDPYLESAQILDCQGRVSATLTLRPDGTVAVRRADGVAVLVRPATRTVLTPGFRLDDGLLDAACALART